MLTCGATPGGKAVQNLAIVGLGGWGRRIVESVQGKSERARIAAAVVARPERSADFAAKHALAIGSDYAAVLADPAIDGIISCGPAPLHAEHTSAALAAGKPVLAIKPMGQTLAQARALEAAAKASGALLALGYDRCFYPNVAEMRRRLQAGALGRILHTEGNFCVDRYGAIKPDDWKADPDQVTAGSLADLMLYLTIETLGPMREVHAMAQSDVSPNGLADVTAVLLRAASNATGLLTAIGTTPDYYRFQVFGTEGWLQIRNADQLIFQPREGERETFTLSGPPPLLSEVETFADAIAGKCVFPVPMADALHGIAVLDAMDRSVRSGAAVGV